MESFLLAQLKISSMAVDSKRLRMLWTQEDVVSFLHWLCAADVVTVEASSDVVKFRQSFAMIEDTYSQMLLNEALRCKIVFSDKVVKFLSIAVPPFETRAPAR